MSLAREMLAARSVTSSIAARTVNNGPSASIREIAADGAISPARHCTRIALITDGCTPLVRRLMASTSRPDRLPMLTRLEICDKTKATSSPRSTPHFSGTTCANPKRFSYTTLLEDQHGCAEIRRQAEIRQGSIKARRERDASPQEGNAQVWPKRKDSKEPQAGDCDRLVRGAKEGSQGSTEARKKIELGRKKSGSWFQC